MSEIDLKKEIDYYRRICYPKPNQSLYIHGEDIECLVPALIAHAPKCVVEIGAAYGTSSKLFASFAKKNNGVVYSIDPNFAPEWEANMKEHDLLNYTIPIRAESPWLTWERSSPIDFLFIDGFHNYMNVIVDFFYWNKYVREGGLIVFHDTKKFPAIKRAINEILKHESLELIDSSRSKVGLEIYKKVKNPLAESVFFGPWVGEFGWEVCWWQGWCRKRSRDYKHVIVSTYSGNEGLYEDFADEVIGHNLTGNPMCGYANNLQGDFDFPNVGKVFVPPEKQFIAHEFQEYYMFGNKNPIKEYDILIQVNEQSRKKYPYWKELLQKLSGLKIACYGKLGRWPDDHLDGTKDLRDIPISELVRHMAGCKAVVGPGSGATHLASYCAANIVVWTDKRTYTWGQNLRDRYERLLNPFNSPVIVLDDWEYSPPAEEVYNAIAKFI